MEAGSLLDQALRRRPTSERRMLLEAATSNVVADQQEDQYLRHFEGIVANRDLAFLINLEKDRSISRLQLVLAHRNPKLDSLSL
jgi:hypothetical protein